SRGRSIPASVMIALAVNGFFLALLALEVSDSLVRRGGAMALSLFFFPPALVLFWGLLTSRRWAWVTARGVALVFTLVYLGVTMMVCIAQPRDGHGRVWVWIATVGLALASILAGSFFALGRPSARRFYGRE